jgi:enoyl-[acyl-carrier-protein] reductase (NADH)
MGLLVCKNALIIGLSSDRAIAWGIAQALHSEGVTIGFTYQRESRKRHVDALAVQRLGRSRYRRNTVGGRGAASYRSSIVNSP